MGDLTGNVPSKSFKSLHILSSAQPIYASVYVVNFSRAHNQAPRDTDSASLVHILCHFHYLLQSFRQENDENMDKFTTVDFQHGCVDIRLN